MKKTIIIIKAMMLASILILAQSCEKDEGKLPNLSFKTGATYVSSDITKDAGTPFIIGIDASKSEGKDVLKKFNISKSINGGANISILDKDLSGSDGDKYNYDFATTTDTPTGQKSKYTFTVTNRDGLTNQVSLTVTTK